MLWKLLLAWLVVDTDVDGFIRIIALALLISAILSGCASPDVTVLGGCELPAALDYEAQGAATLTAKNFKQHLVEEKLERREHDKLAGDYNALRAHVKDHCQ